MYLWNYTKFHSKDASVGTKAISLTAQKAYIIILLLQALGWQFLTNIALLVVNIAHLSLWYVLNEIPKCVIQIYINELLSFSFYQ